MSTKLTGYVWDGCASSGMKLSSVAIMARLADFSNDEGVCWPSIETIARQIGAGMSTVRTAIARLEAEGWLTRKARRQGNRNASNVYQLNVAKLQAAAFSQLSDSDPSKSDASKSDPSKFDASKSGKKAGFHPSESGGDPSVKSKHDPSDKKPSRPDASQPDTQTDEQDFLTRHPDAVAFGVVYAYKIFSEGMLRYGSLVLAVCCRLMLHEVEHARLLAERRTDASCKLGEVVCRVQQIGRASVGKECRSRWSPYH